MTVDGPKACSPVRESVMPGEACCFEYLPRPEPKAVVGGPKTGSPVRESVMPEKTCFVFSNYPGRSQRQ